MRTYRKTKIAGAITAALLATALVGCSTSTPQAEPGGVISKIQEFTLTLTDGRTIPCITYDRGIDCDWESAQ